MKMLHRNAIQEANHAELTSLRRDSLGTKIAKGATALAFVAASSLGVASAASAHNKAAKVNQHPKVVFEVNGAIFGINVYSTNISNASGGFFAGECKMVVTEKKNGKFVELKNQALEFQVLSAFTDATNGANYTLC